MKIATLLFTYNRDYHTEQVLNALKKNIVLPQKLFVFQDGLKDGDDPNKWNAVNSFVSSINWCDAEVIVSEYNKGLSDSIISGINHVFKSYDAVIVLEDDCVPAKNFISFMNQGLNKYEKNERIYSISGYSWPIRLEKHQYDIYGCGRISSWGWGTWKDRWSQYKIDNDILKRLKNDRRKSYCLATWGNDCENMVLGNVVGKNDSWAVYWALNVIENEGICINPYESLIQNIGIDGTGVHCGISERFQTILPDGEKKEFALPDNIEILHETKKAFAELYGSYTAVNIKNKYNLNVLIYGLGDFYSCYEKEINNEYNIVAFIDKQKKGWYAGKKIITLNEMKNYNYDKVIIMVRNIQDCITISKDLINNNVAVEQIVFGNHKYNENFSGIDKWCTLPSGKMSITFENISMVVQSEDEFNNVYEIFVNQTYNYFINNGRSDIILDVGMNIGDSVLYFLNHDNVKKIYGYEPFTKTYLSAKENLKNYLHNHEKLEIFQYGISNKNEKRRIKFNKNMTCGESSIIDIRQKTHKFCLDEGSINQDDEEIEEIEVKRASCVFKTIIKEHPDYNIILKMDCEGEEYCILEELLESRILRNITFLMLKWHYEGKDTILMILKKSGFSCWCNDKNKNMGLIYAYR